jgi:hypothetical protein
MKTWAGIIASVLFIAGCASWGSLYYHERSDGTRYYVTRTGALIAIDKDGRVIEAPVMYEGVLTKPLQKKGDDWDLSAVDIGVPPGHCMELLSRRPESCLNRIWEGPALVLMSPVLFLPTPPLIGDPLYIYPSPSAVADRQ